MIYSKRFYGRQLLAVAIAALMLLAIGSVAQAKYERDFAGHYQIQDVTDFGATVRLTLTIRLVNYSGADVTSATVTVRDPLFMQRILGTLSPAPLSVAKGRSVSVTGEVVVPRREYDIWKTGAHPTVILTQKGPSGKDLGSRVELVQRPFGEVQ